MRIDMRQIALDTETTGIGHDKGHRIIEIGCVELIDRKLTGNTYHVYLNPERPVDPGAFKVHGISDDFLKDKPLFNQIGAAFLDFVTDAELIIHNAPFDTGFINAEFSRMKKMPVLETVSRIVDTLVIARQKHPGQKNNLDALCKRYSIDNSNRQLHGALVDAEILARVYLAMTGGQIQLFGEGDSDNDIRLPSQEKTQPIQVYDFPVLEASQDESASHAAFVKKIAQKAGVDYWEE